MTGKVYLLRTMETIAGLLKKTMTCIVYQQIHSPWNEFKILNVNLDVQTDISIKERRHRDPAWKTFTSFFSVAT